MAEVNEALFAPSEWDDYPLKRDDKHQNRVVEPDFCPFGEGETPLPSGFRFAALRLDADEDVRRACAFLNEHGPETRYHVSPARMRHALDVPCRNFPNAALVRETCALFAVETAGADPAIVGVIASRPITYRIDLQTVCTLEVGWLCTHAKTRGKRLAAILMKEMYRRAHAVGVDVGMLFSLPGRIPALATCGPVDVLCYELGQDEPMPTKNIDNIRFANKRDASKLLKIYRRYQERWRMHREMTGREFRHWHLERGNVSTYVMRTDRGDVKDFASLLELRAPDSEQRVAFVQTITYVNKPLLRVFLQNLVYIAQRCGFARLVLCDVHNVGETATELGFSPTGQRYWMYLFNYNTLAIGASQQQITPWVY